MDYLRCAWCDINENFDEPLFPHTHPGGRIPVTPCRACSVGNHGRCEPIAPWWCACDCGLREEAGDA